MSPRAQRSSEWFEQSLGSVDNSHKIVYIKFAYIFRPFIGGQPIFSCKNTACDKSDHFKSLLYFSKKCLRFENTVSVSHFLHDKNKVINDPFKQPLRAALSWAAVGCCPTATSTTGEHVIDELHDHKLFCMRISQMFCIFPEIRIKKALKPF